VHRRINNKVEVETLLEFSERLEEAKGSSSTDGCRGYPDSLLGLSYFICRLLRASKAEINVAKSRDLLGMVPHPQGMWGSCRILTNQGIQLLLFAFVKPSTRRLRVLVETFVPTVPPSVSIFVYPLLKEDAGSAGNVIERGLAL
jgi:hypothetical protein